MNDSNERKKLIYLRYLAPYTTSFSSSFFSPPPDLRECDLFLCEKAAYVFNSFQWSVFIG